MCPKTIYFIIKLFSNILMYTAAKVRTMLPVTAAPD